MNTPTIQTLPLPQLYKQLRQTLTRIQALAPAHPSDPHIQLLLEEIALDLPSLEGFLHLPRKKPLIRALEEAHQDRTQAIRALYESIKPFRVSCRPERQTLFRHFNHLFTQFRYMQSRPYDRATVLTEHFIEKLKSAPYFDAIRTSHMQTLFEDLILSQSNFVQLYRTSQIRERRPNQMTCGQIRNRLESRFLLLHQYLENHLAFNNESPYQAWLEIIQEETNKDLKHEQTPST